MTLSSPVGQRIINIIFGLVFLFALWAPLFKDQINLYQTFSKYISDTQVEIAKAESKSAQTYVETFENYFKIKFGYRDQLILLSNNTMVKLFRYTKNASVVAGKDEWLFYTKGLTDNWTRPAYSSGTYDQIKTKEIDLAGFIDAKDILYVNLIPPDKHLVYPEYLPFEGSSKLRSPRTLQKFEILKEINQVKVVNLMPIFAEHKKLKQLYYKNDTHWNNHGSFVAYQEVMKVVKEKYPQIEILEEGDFDILIEDDAYIGDLSRNLQVSNSDKKITYILKEESKANKLSEDKKLNTVIIYFDSFFDPQYEWGTINFIQNHFNQTITVRNIWAVDREQIELENPEVFIYQVVERDL